MMNSQATESYHYNLDAYCIDFFFPVCFNTILLVMAMQNKIQRDCISVLFPWRVYSRVLGLVISHVFSCAE